jgi:uncharacterized OB-fold protein
MTEAISAQGWPQPYRLPDAEPYWAALAGNELTFQRCAGCAQAVWPAHSYCPHCGSPSLGWERSQGRGEVWSHSTIMRGPTPVWASITPYTVGFIKMDEGYYLFSQIDAEPDAVRIGERVTMRIVERGAQKMPVFVVSDR